MGLEEKLLNNNEIDKTKIKKYSYIYKDWGEGGWDWGGVEWGV